MNNRIDVLGVGFDAVTMAKAVDRALALMEEKNSEYVVTPNPEIVMRARDDAGFRAAIEGAALVLPDGVGIVRGAAMLGTPVPEKVPGIDFASNVMERLAQRGGSVFLFGAKPGVAEKAGDTLAAAHPGLVIAGTADGYFTDDAPILERIRVSEPDLLLVCLGAPKQELWMQNHAHALPVGLMAGLGGSLDVYAGTVKRAPEAWQKLGLEWLYRLIREPSRLGRMMVLPRFILEVKSEKRKRDVKG